jgi:hypothetical protein
VRSPASRDDNIQSYNAQAAVDATVQTILPKSFHRKNQPVPRGFPIIAQSVFQYYPTKARRILVAELAFAIDAIAKTLDLAYTVELSKRRRELRVGRLASEGEP